MGTLLRVYALVLLAAAGSIDLAAQVTNTYVYNEIIDLASPGADGFNYPLISRSGNRILYTETSGGTTSVWAINPDGSNATQIDTESTTPDAYHYLSISDDGSKALVWSTNKILIVNTDGTDPLTLVTVDGNFGISQARITGDGSKVIFANDDDDNLTTSGSTPLVAGIYSIKPDGTSLTALVTEDALANYLGLMEGYIRGVGGYGGMDVSSDGSHIVFTTNFALSGNYLMAFDGSSLNTIFGPIPSVFTTGISEDGSTIWYNCVFTSLAPNEIGVVPFAGGTRTALVTGIQNNSGGIATDLQLTTDGSLLLFGDDGMGRLINTDGSGITPLFVTTQNLNGPLIQQTSYMTVTMDSTGTNFAFAEPARGLFPTVLEIGLLTRNPVSTGAAPAVTNPAANPDYILVNGGSSSTVSATVTAPSSIGAVSVALLVPTTAAQVGLNNYGLGEGSNNLYSGSFQGGYDDQTGARTVRVQAEDTDSNSLRHGTAVDFVPFYIDSAAPASQSISFSTLSNVTLGLAPFTISASATSNLTVTFSSTTTLVCTVSGSTVTLLTKGTCSIMATQAGNQAYAAATPVTQSFTVAGESQTISFGTLSNQTLGTAPFALSATASSNLTVAFVSNNLSACTVSGVTVTLVATGTCSITASQGGSPTYAAAVSVTQTFTVAREPQYIDFPDLSVQTLGTKPFSLSATATSGLTVAFASNSKTICTVSGVTLTLVTTGTCSITASQAGNATFAAATPVTWLVPIYKTQTVTFAALPNRTLATPTFTLSATASSGLSVQFVSHTSDVCSVTGTKVTLLEIGACTIIAAQPGTTVYLPSAPVSQTFNVLGKPQTINFTAPKTQTMGNAPFDLSATATSKLAVTFASNTETICSVSGVTLTLVGSGTCSITAGQAGDSTTWAAATSVTRTFVVDGEPQTISFTSPGNQVLGTGSVELNALSSSALTVLFASTTKAICTVSGDEVTLIKLGTCSITASQSGSTIFAAAKPVTRTFTIVNP